MKVVKTLYKTAAYRIVSFFLTLMIMFIISGEPWEATLLTIILECVKTAVYFLFEMFWEEIEKRRK